MPLGAVQFLRPSQGARHPACWIPFWCRWDMTSTGTRMRRSPRCSQRHGEGSVRFSLSMFWPDRAFPARVNRMAERCLGCGVAGLLGCWVAGLLGCWGAGVLGCWVACLLGWLVVWLVGCLFVCLFVWFAHPLRRSSADMPAHDKHARSSAPAQHCILHAATKR